MRKDIMLCFLSDVKTQDKKISVAEYQNIGDQKECHTTNESAVRYLLYGSNEPVDKLSRLFLVRTNKVTGNITCLVKEQDLEGKETSRYTDYKDEQERTWTHYKYFLHRISELIADTEEIEDIRVRDIVEHIDFDEDKPIEENMNALIRVASCVRAYAKSVREDDPAAEIVLHVDCTGGMRNASMILVALMRLLQYERIEIGKVLYSNFNRNDPQKNRVEEVNPLYSFFDLVAGAEEFVRHGEVTVLNKFFEKRERSIHLDTLLNAMQKFAEELKLCHYGDLSEAITALRDAIHDFPEITPSDVSSAAKQNDDLMCQMLARIQEDYAPILKEELDDIALIRWCISHNLLQQAMTLFTERVPESLVKSEFLWIQPAYQTDFSNEQKKDSMNRTEAFYLVNIYPKSRGDVGQQKDTQDTMLNRAKKVWKERFGEFLQNLLTEPHHVEKQDIHKLLEKPLPEFDEIRLSNAAELGKILFSIHTMCRAQAGEISPVRAQIQDYLERVQKWYTDPKTVKAHAITQPEDIFTKDDHELAGTIIKFMEEKVGQARFYLSVERMRGAVRMNEGRLCSRNPEKARSILTRYFDIKDERNHTSHAGNKTRRFDSAELEKQMSIALDEIEDACAKEKVECNAFINHTNHPSSRWEEGQKREAEGYGTLVDLAFPAIPPDWSKDEVCRLAEENARTILARKPAAVLVQGEFSYTFALVSILKEAGIPTLSACSERHVSERTDENGEIVRESRFAFRGFRTY